MSTIKRLIVSLFVFISLVSPSLSAQVIQIDFDIWKNNTIENLTIIGEYGAYERYSEYFSLGSYKVVLVDSNGEIIYEDKFDVSFYLLSDPPIELNCTHISLTLPYFNETKTIMIYYNNTLLAQGEIGFVCIKDGICERRCEYDPDCGRIVFCNHNGIYEENENYFDCPSDCPSGSRDGICDGVKDGRFDPDCYNYPWSDPDCLSVEYPCLNLTRNLENLELLQNRTCFCNHNGICEENETWYTCPSDCKPCVGNITCNGEIICNCYGDLECLPFEKETRGIIIYPKEEVKREIKISKAPLYVKIGIVSIIFIFIGFSIYRYYVKK